jgi:hypothetical protein
MTGTCARCHREFEPRRKGQKYCYPECRRLASKEAHWRDERLAYLTNKINVLTAERDKILAESDTKGLL